MNEQEKFKLINDKIEDMRTCMFLTHDASGAVIGRPMGTQELEFDGTVWFMTDKRSKKCAELREDPTVSLAYAHSNGIRFVSLSGTASFVEDKAKIKEFWNGFYKAWFEGPEDPNITLLQVKVSRAEFWDNSAGKAGALADMAIGAVTGKANSLDEHEVFEF